VIDPPTCTVIRVPRSDTLLIRTFLPQVQASVNTTMVLCGIKPTTDARQHIIDWVEVHADFERLRLLTPDWTRDSYGRLLADLGDPKSGELLTDYLREVKACEDYPSHYLDCLTDMMTAPEPQV
jgi:hypothetical protein